MIHKEILRDKICNIKEFWGNKFVGMWVILKPSLVFNWVMFLGGFSV